MFKKLIIILTFATTAATHPPIPVLPTGTNLPPATLTTTNEVVIDNTAPSLEILDTKGVMTIFLTKIEVQTSTNLVNWRTVAVYRTNVPIYIEMVSTQHQAFYRGVFFINDNN